MRTRLDCYRLQRPPLQWSALELRIALAWWSCTGLSRGESM